MRRIAWRTLVGQERVREVLGTAFANNALGHAYLFCGEEGTGTFAAAADLAMAVLCTAADALPCGSCDSCLRLLNHAHPDCHIVFPVVLQKEEKGSDGTLKQKGWNSLAARARQRMADPYIPPEDDTVPFIPVEWIREVNDAIRRGAVGTGMNVAIMAGVDLMSRESANTLLKTLEEPPAGTLMILCAEQLHDVPRTIVSRCQIVRFVALPPQAVESALTARFSSSVSASRITEAAQASQGSLGRAIGLVSESHSRVRDIGEELLGLAGASDPVAACRRIDAIAAQSDGETLARALTHCLHRLRASALSGITLGRTYFAESPATEVPAMDLATAGRVAAACETAIRALRSRVNPGLVISTFVIETAEILHGQ